MKILFSSALLGTFLMLASCAREKEPYVFPATLASRWKLESQASFPTSESPEAIRSLAMPKAWIAKYSIGTRQITITVYEAAADAVAFEAAQKWRRQDGQMAFHKGTYFVVVESMGSDTVELNGIVTAVEATFDPRR